MDEADAGAEARPAVAELTLADVSAAVSSVAAGAGLAERAVRLLQAIRQWATPAAVLAFVQDGAGEAGLRLLPELSAGHPSPGQERTLARLFEEAVGERRTAPWLIPPPPDVAGYRVKPLDSWMIPWSGSAARGFMVLRGVTAPYPPNLAAAVDLAAQGVWALVPAPSDGHAADAVGATGASLPGARVDALAEAARALQALAAGLRDQVEGLRADAAAHTPGPAAGGGVPALEAAAREAETLNARVAELESAAESARAENTALRERLAEAQAAAAARAAGGGDETRSLREQLEAAQAALTQAEGAREALQAEAHQAREQVETHKHLADELRDRVAALEHQATRGEDDRQTLDAVRQALRVSEGMLAKQTSELESTRRQRVALQEQVEAAERARANAEAERDRARAEINPLWATIESLQRQLRDEQGRLAEGGAGQADLRAAQAQLEELRAKLAEVEKGAAAETEERLRQAEERARQAEQRVAERDTRWASTVEAVRGAQQALKRTPFVPPTLRMAFAPAEAALEIGGAAPDKGAGKPTRILLLDRDTLSLDRLAEELEAAGVDVLVAHYADEAAFFLKTPEARQITAVVADVMAFRSDAEMLERFRLWRLDMPALGLIVSYRTEDAAEFERARRLPLALGAGHAGRPLAADAVQEAVTVAVRRASRPTESVTGAHPRIKR